MCIADDGPGCFRSLVRASSMKETGGRPSGLTGIANDVVAEEKRLERHKADTTKGSIGSPG